MRDHDHKKRCLKEADDCCRKALAATTEPVREPYLDMQARWLRLAMDYDPPADVEDVVASDRQQGSWMMSNDDPAWQPGDVRDLLDCIRNGGKVEDLAPYLSRTEVEVRDKAREFGWEDERGLWVKKPPAPSIARQAPGRRAAS